LTQTSSEGASRALVATGGAGDRLEGAVGALEAVDGASDPADAWLTQLAVDFGFARL
jgi:hypothetical protein